MSDSPLLYIGTHDNAFHTDDVLAVAILKRIFPNTKVLRSRDPDIWDMCDFLVDVGGEYDHATRKYDHHMQHPPTYDDGRMLSSAGLIWRHYAQTYLRSIGVSHYTRPIGGKVHDMYRHVIRLMGRRWILPIDQNDNGFGTGHTPLLDTVSALNPIKASSRDEYDAQFMLAVQVATAIFERACFHAVEHVMTQLTFESSEVIYMEDSKILVSPVETKDFSMFINTPVCFVIYPVKYAFEKDEKFIIRPIFKRDEQSYKVPLPARLMGCDHNTLIEMGYDQISFIHHNGFMIRAESLSAAIEFCKKMIVYDMTQGQDSHRQMIRN